MSVPLVGLLSATTERRQFMTNQLGMDKVHAIKSLHATGMSERRIASTLGISRKAVRRHLGRGAPKDTKAPTGKAPTGSSDSKDTKAPTGSAAASPATNASLRSCALVHQDSILEKLWPAPQKLIQMI